MSGLGGYVHPVYQTMVLIAGLAVLALGLRLRKSRRVGAGPKTARLASYHMRLGRWFIALYAGGYLLGLGGMRFALDEPNFETAHAYFATLGIVLMLATAYLGRRLRLSPGEADLRQLHAYCGFLAIFVSLVVAFLGMNLLP